jgi:methionyl-tRNA formyltransferase
VRVVFAGTPAAAVPSLTALVASRHDVAAVVTRPDAPAGRGRTLRPSAVKSRALELGLDLLTPAKVGDPEFLAQLRDIAPDCCAVVAYGALLPESALEIPQHGWVNLHFSLLPAWRGAAPVQHALLAGDDVTGATTFRIERDLDTGPIFGVVTTDIRQRETAGELLDRLAHVGADLLVATLDAIADDTITSTPQPTEGVSYAPKMGAADARVDWRAPAMRVDRQVRACTPEPGAWTTFRGKRMGVDPVRVVSDATTDLAPGQLGVTKSAVLVGTGGGVVELGDVRPEGKPAMAGEAWARGVRPNADERFE